MSIDKQKTIMIISGPCGVGKSTITKEMVQRLDQCVLIEGDRIMDMFSGKSKPSWEEMLLLTWENILAVTRNFVQHDWNVIIDYVVEDELEWFCKQLADLNISIKYIVLRADKETLIERINQRGNTDLIDRSLFLLSLLENDSQNQPYLYDTTHKKVSAIVDDLVHAVFDLNKPFQLIRGE